MAKDILAGRLMKAVFHSSIATYRKFSLYWALLIVTILWLGTDAINKFSF